MDFWIDIGFAVLLRLLKNRRDAEKFKLAFYKIHGAIETAFPELQPGSDEDPSKVRP